MNITEQTVADIASFTEGAVIDEALKETLKSKYPGIRFTLCSEDDIFTGKPVIESQGFDIYLVGSSEHCLTLTNDYDIAAGVVIAEKYDEE